MLTCPTNQCEDDVEINLHVFKATRVHPLKKLPCFALPVVFFCKIQPSEVLMLLVRTLGSRAYHKHTTL